MFHARYSPEGRGRGTVRHDPPVDAEVERAVLAALTDGTGRFAILREGRRYEVVLEGRLGHGGRARFAVDGAPASHAAIVGPDSVALEHLGAYFAVAKPEAERIAAAPRPLVLSVSSDAALAELVRPLELAVARALLPIEISLGRRGLGVALVAALAVGGYMAARAVVAGSASIPRFVAGPHATDPTQTMVALELLFERAPRLGDPRDVSLVIEIGDRAERFDWARIANEDTVGAGWMKGHRANEATTPDGPVPLGERLTLRFPWSARQAHPDLEARATLRWAGRALDTRSVIVEGRRLNKR